MSTIKNVSYAAAAGFTVGSLTAVALYRNFTARSAGAAYAYFPYTGVVFGVTAAVCRAVDEVFKAIGWTSNSTLRLITAHVVVGLVLAPLASLYIGRPHEVGKAIGIALTIASLAVNLFVK